MKQYNKWILSALCGLSICYVCAEEPSDTSYVKHDVVIEKEYQPEILDSRRLSVELPITEYPSTKENVVYSNYSNQLSSLTPFLPTTQTEMTIMNRLAPKQGYARVGLGYPLQWLADLWYPLLDKRNDTFLFNLNHQGLYSKLQHDIITNLGVSYEHRFESVKIQSYIGYGNQYFNYYGTDSLNPTSQYLFSNNQTLPTDSMFKDYEVIHRLEAGLGLASITTNSGWSYELGIGYRMAYLQKVGIGEHNLLVNGNFEGPIGENTLRIGLDLNTLFYSLGESVMMQRKVTNAVFGVKPAYILNWENGSLRLGAKVFFSTSTGRIINAMPDIKGVYNVKQSIQLYAGIGGDYRINSLSNMLEGNLFYDPYLKTIKNSYTPIDLFIGCNIKPIKGMVIDAHLNYNFTNDNYYFTNERFASHQTIDGKDSIVTDLSNRFRANSINTRQLKLGVRVAYNYKELYRFYAEGQFNSFSNKGIEHFLMPYTPKWEATFGTEIQATNALVIHGDFWFASKRATALPDGMLGQEPEALSPIYQLNLGAHYTLKNQITFFIRANNLLSLIPDLQYDNWYGYKNLGFNIMAGASFAF